MRQKMQERIRMKVRILMAARSQEDWTQLWIFPTLALNQNILDETVCQSKWPQDDTCQYEYINLTF